MFMNSCTGIYWKLCDESWLSSFLKYDSDSVGYGAVEAGYQLKVFDEYRTGNCMRNLQLWD